MARFVRIVALTLVGLVCAAPAEANWLGEFLRGVARDTKRRNCWPKPFECPDRHSARAPFGLMVANGWRRQNMLADHHFLQQTNELTEAGQLKVRWIVTEAPREHRIIYVHKAANPEATAVRIEQVQQFVTRLAPEGGLPPVLQTSIPDHGWPASELDVIGRKFQASMPEPRLPAPQESGLGG